jgi:hypothetical protein
MNSMHLHALIWPPISLMPFTFKTKLQAMMACNSKIFGYYAMRCIHDQGTKFSGADFQYMSMLQAGIKDVPTTVHNLQEDNAVCEWLHQSVANILWILLSQNPPNDVANVGELVGSALATSLHAAPSTIHLTLGISPGGLVFH